MSARAPSTPGVRRRTALLAAGALVLLSVLFLRGQPWSVEEHDHYRTQLRLLRVHSSDFEMAVLESRLGVGASSRDQLQQLLTESRELEQFPGFLDARARTGMLASLQRYLSLIHI